MIKKGVPEKPDMQDYVRNHPWLINPQWTTLVHERSLDNLIAGEFGMDKSGEDEGRRRLDFFCLGDKYRTAYVVETKRPGALVGREEFDQLRDYVLFLQDKLQSDADEEHRRTTVSGLLIADRIRSGDKRHAQEHQKAGTFDIRAWGNLLSTAETLHEEFLNVVRTRAPADDPQDEELVSGFS